MDRCLLAAVWSLGFFGCSIPCLAQEGNANAQTPTTPKMFKIDLGYLANFARDSKDRLYYRLDYKGLPVTRKGAPITFQSQDRPVESPGFDSGDSPDVAFKLERGVLSSSGTLFDLLGVRPLEGLGNAFRSIRGIVQGTGKLLNGDLHVNLAGGLESPPLHPAAALRLNVPNWLVLGLVGESQDSSPQGSEVGMLTYRSFIGQGFRWVESAELVKMKEGLEADILALASTYRAAEPIARSFVSGKAQDKYWAKQVIRGLVDLLRDQVQGQPQLAEDSSFWAARVHEAAMAFTSTPDRPTWVILAESAGWYTFAGKNGPRRLNALLALGATYYFAPEAKDPTFIQARYELGFDRAAPDTRKHFAGLVLGISF